MMAYVGAQADKFVEAVYEKLAQTFLSFVYLAASMIWIK